MHVFSSDKTKGGAKMKKQSKKGKIVLLGVLSASLVSCSPVVNKNIGLYPLNSPEVQKDCPPFPKNVWGDPRLYTALDPVVVLGKSEVKVKQWNISKDIISYHVEIPYALKEYVQKYGSEKYSETPLPGGIARMHLRLVKKGSDFWYPLEDSTLERDLTDVKNYYMNLDVPSKVYFASSVVKRFPSELDRRTDYPSSMSSVAKGLVTDKGKAFCIEVDKQERISTEVVHVFGPSSYGYRHIMSKPISKRRYVYNIKQIHSNKISYVENPKQMYILTSIDTEKGSDRALFLKVFVNNDNRDMIYRMQCLLKEDIEFYMQKNPFIKSKLYVNVCGDGFDPFFICMEFKDAICYIAEKLNYKSLAEHLYGGGSSLIGDTQAKWFRHLLEEKLKERQNNQ